MKILVTGACGYIGYPLMLELHEKTKHTIVGVDNGNRNEWVENCGGVPFYPDECNVIHGDLTDYSLVRELLAIHKPDVIIHLASQPSMPYSQINGERALYTQVNNLSMCLNLLWGLKENDLLKTRFILTTTTGIPGQHYRTIKEQDTLNVAGSWYHVSRGFDSSNISLASRQWDLQTVEFRTSIVYGIQTELMKELGTVTRFDTDSYFGTVVNRFVNQVVNKENITVYGKGLQTKPFIALEDVVHSLVNAIRYKFPKGHTILNQVTEICSIDKLATTVQNWTDATIKRVPNPRKEKETFKMKFENSKFLKVLGQKPKELRVGTGEMIAYLTDKIKPSYLTFNGEGELGNKCKLK